MKLAHYMQAKGLTDAALASKLGVHPSSVNRMRRSKSRPDWPALVALARLTKGLVMPNDFLKLSR